LPAGCAAGFSHRSLAPILVAKLARRLNNIEMSPIGTKRTNRAGLAMSVVRGEPEMARKAHLDRDLLVADISL
jgi:hypothetical protein